MCVGRENRTNRRRCTDRDKRTKNMGIFEVIGVFVDQRDVPETVLSTRAPRGGFFTGF